MLFSAAVSKVPPRVRSKFFAPNKARLRIVIILVMPLILPHTHTLGSNSTATLGPSVVELITFATLSWSVIVLFVMLAVIGWCETKGKQSIKEHDLEFYSRR